MTDKGKKRASNQDNFAIKTVGDYLLCVVCDGMGGIGGGNIASEIACEYYVEKFSDSILSVDDPSLITQKILERFVMNSVDKANAEVIRESERSPQLKGMGTTLTTAIVAQNGVLLGNVGDSRIYHIADNEIVQLTKDHSYVQTLVDAGKITPQQAAVHPNKNIITRAVGVDRQVQCDLTYLKLPAGYLLLCSDGLSNYLDPKAFCEILREDNTLEDKCKKLIDHANNCGGADNITVVLIKL